MTLLDLLLIVGLVWRVVRLVQLDTILDRPRMWITGRAPWFVESLLICPWCLSVWVGLIVVGAWSVGNDPTWFEFIAAVASASAVTAFAIIHEPGE